MRELQGWRMAGFEFAGREGVRDWRRWAPYAAVAWSLVYAVLGIYWVARGRGFPYAPEAVPDVLGPIVGRLGPSVPWVVVIMAGLPAAALGVAMLRGVQGRVLRPLFIIAGAMLAGVLLLCMTGLNLLVLLGYVPYAVLGRLTAEKSREYLAAWTQWKTVHQLLCLAGGFLWLAATVCYSRRSGRICPYCGRPGGPEGWQGPDQAARWGRSAVYVSMVAPVFYAFTRYAWALGFPLGMSEEYLRRGQESGIWISGLFLATFGLVGVVLTLGLVQQWGEKFPRWMIGLAGRRVPIALAVIPASLMSVLLVVGGIAIWFSLGGMVAAVEAGGARGIGVVEEIVFQVGPTLLFPLWGTALAAATLAYFYRRRNPCVACGRGTSSGN